MSTKEMGRLTSQEWGAKERGEGKGGKKGVGVKTKEKDAPCGKKK